MSEFAIVTVVTQSHFHTARALALSVRDVHPDVPIYVCLIDRSPLPLGWEPGPGAVFYADELGIGDWPRFAFQYTAFELVCAVKPFAVAKALFELGAERALYFDTDIQVHGRLDGIARALDASNVVLTAHLTAPLPPDGKQPDELDIVRAGTYNAGFVGVRRSDISRDILKWWQGKTRRYCVTDIPARLHVDQSWLDLLPGLFDGVRVERQSGWNVAVWNLPHRDVRLSPAGEWLVNGEPLVFFHFTGFDPRRPDIISAHQTRYRMDDIPAVAELARRYCRRLDECERARYAGRAYPFNRLTDGTPIRDVWREAVRMGHPLLANVTDPFDTAATPDLVARLGAAEADAANSRMGWRYQRGRRLADRLAQVQNSPLLGRLLRFYRWLGKIDW